MTEIHATSVHLPSIPDNLTIPQFILDFNHSTRPFRPEGVPWLIEDSSGRQITSEELRCRCRGLANALSLRWNIGDGDVVCIFSPNHVDYPVATWAVHRLGGTITPANPTYTSDELAYQLNTANAGLIIAHPDFRETALAAARKAGIPGSHVALFNRVSSTGLTSRSAQPTLDELISFGWSKERSYSEKRLYPGQSKKQVAFLCFSSGTTGKPKAVIISHYSVIANVIQMALHSRFNEVGFENGPLKPGDVVTAVLPFFHIYGLVVNMHYSMFAGMTLVVIPKFNFLNFLKSIVRYRITHFYLVPPQIVLLCKHPAVKEHDLSHVKYIVSGAAPLSAELIHQLVKLFPDCSVGQGYGMTETCTTICMLPPTQKVGTIGSAGQLIPGIVARVIKADGSLARYGEEGELVVTGPSMATGYANNPEATKEAFVDGWVRTGDKVYINENNEVFVVDRLKEIMKVRGYQVAPAELEGHLLNHPDVSDACVVSIPDDYSGEIPLAYIVLNPLCLKRIQKDPIEVSKTKKDLIKFVADAKVSYKWLAGGVEFIDVIPRNPSGKLLRRVLRDKAMKSRVVSSPQTKL